MFSAEFVYFSSKDNIFIKKNITHVVHVNDIPIFTVRSAVLLL